VIDLILYKGIRLYMYKEGTTDDGKKGAIYGGCKGYSKLL
jgi:hypothetical protein